MSNVNYTKVNWQAYPNKQTKLTAANLNIMDQGIYDCAAQINTINGILPSQPFVMQELTTSDLDSVTTPGYYMQGSSDNATQGRHYPCPLAGYLEVLQAEQDIIQRYRPSTTVDYFTEFIRRRYHGTWSTWMSTDFVQLAFFSQQSITTAGISTGITRGQLTINTRDIAIRLYGIGLRIESSYGATADYVSFTWLLGPGNPSSSTKILLRAEGRSSSTVANLYLLDSQGNISAGTLPQIEILTKLGRDYPTCFI